MNSLTVSMVCRTQGGNAGWRVIDMVIGVILTGIAGLVFLEAVSEGIHCSSKLRDRYHE
jgi:hypothetical protein